MSCLLTEERVIGPIKIRPSGVLAKGQGVFGDLHAFDHATILIKGSVHVKAKLPDGSVREHDFVAPDEFVIYKDVEHEITALEDGTVWYCVYPHRDPTTKEVVERFNGWDGAHR